MLGRELLTKYRNGYAGIIIADLMNRGKLPTMLLPGNQKMAEDIADRRKIKPEETETEENERV